MKKIHSYQSSWLRVVFPDNIRIYMNSQFMLCHSVFVFPRLLDLFEEKKETARSLILSEIETHANTTDYFHGLAPFGADSRKCFARMHDFV